MRPQRRFCCALSNNKLQRRYVFYLWFIDHNLTILIPYLSRWDAGGDFDASGDFR